VKVTKVVTGEEAEESQTLGSIPEIVGVWSATVTGARPNTGIIGQAPLPHIVPGIGTSPQLTSIVPEPGATPVTRPELLTVATAVSWLDQVALHEAVPPVFRVTDAVACTDCGPLIPMEVGSM
jgi:hypothetical protein